MASAGDSTWKRQSDHAKLAKLAKDAKKPCFEDLHVLTFRVVAG